MNGGTVKIIFDGDDKKLDDKTKGISNKLGGIAKGVGSAVAKGAGIAVAGITALVGASVKGYAEYEQLIGGVETLFKKSAPAVEKYANQAYKTAGMSANQYMETVTSFSASLLQSLGGDTKKASKSADQAIRDMSDNANKMGTSMEMIQNAYQGFAKQNYTMLDNLKLGYGGTKTEMQRLLKDAEKISGIKYDISSLDDVYSAIHVIQNELGITGTTAKEAEATISGSFGMAKASFSNLVTGFAKDGADVGKLMDEFIDSGMTFANNVLPVVERALGSIADNLPKLITKITSMLPSLLQSILPGLITGVTSLITSLITVLPQIFQTLINIITTTLIPQIINMIPQLIPAVVQCIIGLAKGVVQAIPILVAQIPVIIGAIIEGILNSLPDIVMMAPELIVALITGMIKAIPMLIKNGPKIIGGIIKGIVLCFAQMVKNGMDIIIKLIDGIKNGFNKIPSKVKEWVKSKILQPIKDKGISGLKDVGINLIKGLWGGIKSVASWVYDKISGFASGILDKVKGIFGIHSPSKVMFEIGGFIDEGFINGIESMKKQVQTSFGGVFDLSPSLYGTASTNLSPNVNVNVNNNMSMDPLGRVVSDIKTFSGGAKNDYNYGMGGGI